jgi:hypothetical protein
MDHSLSIQHHGLFSPVAYMYRVVYGLMYETGEKRPWCCIDREWSIVSCMEMDHSLSMQHHGLFSPVSYMRPGITICIYNTMVSFSPSPYMRIEWSMISCMKLVRRDHGVA